MFKREGRIISSYPKVKECISLTTEKYVVTKRGYVIHEGKDSDVCKFTWIRRAKIDSGGAEVRHLRRGVWTVAKAVVK